MRISLIQTGLTPGNPAVNAKMMVEKVRQAMKDNPDIIIMPEMWNTSFDWKVVEKTVDYNGVPSAEIMGKLAGQEEVNIIAGSIADKRDGVIYNTAYIFDKKGQKVATYDKVHLISLMREHEFITPGSKIETFELCNVTCGIAICYDLRFPEIMRTLALKGAKVIFLPAQWPMSRLLHWRSLIIARAIENQVYVVANNRVGVEDDTIYAGHSMVVNPWGEVVFEAGDGPVITAVDLDFDLQKKVREKMLVFQDRKPALYDLIIG